MKGNRERAKGGKRVRVEDSKRKEGHGNREGSDQSAFYDFGSHS